MSRLFNIARILLCSAGGLLNNWLMKGHSMKWLACTLFLILLGTSGCASVVERTPGFTHTAALMIGDQRNDVIAQAEHICGSVKMVAYGLQGTPDEFEARRYSFTVEKDLVLYFYNDVFVQARLVEPQSNRFPNIRRDYKEVKRGAPGSREVGYFLKRDENIASIQSITDSQKK